MGYLNSLQVLVSADKDTRRSMSANPRSTLGTSTHATLKRKRHDCLEHSVSDGVNENAGSNTQGGQPLLPRTDGFCSRTEIAGNMDDPSLTKRTKPNEPSPLVSNKEHVPSSKDLTVSAAIWQYIFCFVPPVFLGRLLRVNHAFNSYLGAENNVDDIAPLPHSILQPLTAEAIWRASRRRFAPGLPRPIHGMYELDMWKLLIGQNCQQCGYSQDTDPSVNSRDPWEAGPGRSGVRIIWPFGMRCCGSCLQNISKKVMIPTWY